MTIRNRASLLVHLFTAAGVAAVLRAEAGAEPKWNRLCPMGFTGFRADFPGGKLSFTRDFLATVVANWEREGRLPLQVNYLHRGDTSNDDLPLDEKLAAGWIEALELRADGLYGLIKWTERARGYIERDELRFLSPEIAPNFFDRLGGAPKGQGPTLRGCALLNDPFITDQPRVAAGATPNAAPAAETNMNWKNLLLQVLALAATATDEEITTALEAQKAKVGALEEEKKNLTAQLAEATGKLDLAAKGGGAEVLQLKTALTETTKQLAASNDRITALETEKKEGAIDAYLKGRVEAGVLTPAMTPGVRALALSSGLDKVKAIYDNAPVVVSMGEKGIPGTKDQPTASDAQVKLNAAIDTIVKERGVTRSAAWDIAMRENPALVREIEKA